MSILNTTTEPEILCRLYAIIVQTHKRVASFPKHDRYALGERIEGSLFDCVAASCLAAQEQKGFKVRPILQALARADLAKLLLRMAHELGLLETPAYQRLASELVEITNMLGGWLKYARTQ